MIDAIKKLVTWDNATMVIVLVLLAVYIFAIVLAVLSTALGWGILETKVDKLHKPTTKRKYRG